jgi:hypothetical protein
MAAIPAVFAEALKLHRDEAGTTVRASEPDAFGISQVVSLDLELPSGSKAPLFWRLFVDTRHLLAIKTIWSGGLSAQYSLN